MEKAYRVNSPTVAHENIDGETMVIHFETGSYYNLHGSALVIWDQVVAGGTADDIVAGVQRAYAGGAGEVRHAVLAFLDELSAEHLVVRDGESAASPPGVLATPPIAVHPFEAPQLNKYTDMQDFLLADPVHDTDDAGFPIPKAQRDAPH